MDHYLKRELYERVRTDSEIFEFLQAGSLDGLWYWDIENPAEEWLSPRFKELFGYRDDEIPNTSAWWQENVFPEDLKLVLRNFEAHCADPLHPYDQIVRYRHKDGSTVWVRCRGLAIRNEVGKPIRMLGAHTDVTGLKRTEAGLRQATEELSRSNAELVRFAHVASHDLKSPLNAIEQLARWIEEDLGDKLEGESRENMALLRGRVKRLATLLDDILEFSRISRLSVTSEWVDTEELLAEIAKHIVVPSGFTISSPDDMPVFKTQRGPLMRVFQNLIENAIKHHDRPTGRVEVSAVDRGSFYEFSVVDDGAGIPPEYHKKVFEMFQKLKSRDEVEGSGMGLAIIEKIVKHYGGDVRLESSCEDRWTAFRFDWPK